MTDSNHRQRGAKAPLCLRELPEEARVAVIELLDVVDAPLEHRDTFYAHAEGEAAYFRRIVAVVFHKIEYVRVDHAAAEQFDPAALFTGATALCAAEDARDRHFRARFRERE